MSKKISSSVNPFELVKEEVMNLNFGSVDSLVAYRRNAYRQWGTIANEILDDTNVGKAFVKLIVINGKINDRKNEIAKYRGKDMFQLVELLRFSIDDLQQAVSELSQAISRSNICHRYANHEAINGCGRRLGLRTLQRRTANTLMKIATACRDCEIVAKQAYEDYSMKYDTCSRWGMR